ncbi:MAG: hypothetical protein HYX92_02550 [Chloroflexi bacterium]|nr:hypothetical protein [Chloroflexota bacterium]
MYEVLSPLGEPTVAKAHAVPLISDLKGKTVVMVWNGVFKGDVAFPMIQELLYQRYPGIKVIPYTEFPLQRVTGPTQQLLDRTRTTVDMAVAKGCDAIITGVGG